MEMSSFAAGLLIGRKMGGGSAGSGDDVLAVIPSAATLTIYTAADRSADEPVIKMHSYRLTVKTLCRITQTTNGTKTVMRKWTAEFITAVSDTDGNVIFTADYDTAGKLVMVTKANGDEVYIDALPDVLSGEPDTISVPDSAALGYMIAYNKLAEEVLEKEIDSYKDGADDGSGLDDGDGDASDNDIEITDSEVVIPDGSCMAIRYYQSGYPTSQYKEIYYGVGAGILKAADKNSSTSIGFTIKCTRYENYKNNVLRTSKDYSNYPDGYPVGSAKSLNDNLPVSGWALIGDWYWSDGEAYDGDYVTPYGTAY